MMNQEKQPTIYSRAQRVAPVYSYFWHLLTIYYPIFRRAITGA
jgi:hypothetical protein